MQNREIAFIAIFRCFSEGASRCEPTRYRGTLTRMGLQPATRRDEDDWSRITRILSRAASGDEHAASELLPLVYDQLRKNAELLMRHERRGHTLTATALVHEAYLKFGGDAGASLRSRGQYFAAAAQAMRRILIDHARSRKARKRGSGRKVQDLPAELNLADPENVAEAVILNDLISRLEKEDAQAAKVVQLRFFAGLTVEETAAVMGVSAPTVKRNWQYARAWLLDAYRDGDE